MSLQPFRLDEGGRIDRSRVFGFRFNDASYLGHPGDTLASALLANGVHLVGRSFKYHRRRGILTAGSEEPNALVQLRFGKRTEPNVRATVAELFDGLSATSQNHWPSLSFDLGGLNNLLSPLFPAGFYYKTFMWPASAWETYERVIRRMAGLGRAPSEADPDRYDKHHLHCDVLVVGAGPAGIAAAQWAARTGARVVLADEQAEFGGSLLAGAQSIDGAEAMVWAEAALAELDQSENVRLLPRTTVAGYYDHNFLTMLERSADHVLKPEAGHPRQRLWKVRARQVVLATGALERPLVFAGNDRPGLMLAGAAQTYVRRYAVRPGSRAVVVTNNDSAYQAALDLAAAGVQVQGLFDMRPKPSVTWLPALNDAGIEVTAGRAVAATHGARRVSRVDLVRLDESGRPQAGRTRSVDCDLVCMSGGWNPTLHLYSQAQGRLQWVPERGCFLPGEARQAVRVAGAAAGTVELAACLKEGAEAGNAAANDAGFRRRGRGPRIPDVEERQQSPAGTVMVVPGRGKRFVDQQNDVTIADLELAAREGYRSIEHVKRYTTTGMGTDQGKTSNVTALTVVASALGSEVPAVGHTTFRPPYTPVSFGALAGRDTGPLLDPIRRTPMHGWHVANRAEFEPVGQWLRPYCYPRSGEDIQSAVDREVRAARRSLGIMDATTLGKIDIQGPDAAEFLNRIYVNAWKRLKVGSCRYGLMLHEDGMVFDDGVTARLAEDRFHMTTTTGNAGAVLAWLESWLQTEWPELNVYCNSCTEQFAVVSVCGPNARTLMREVTDGIELENEAFPFMTWRDGRVAGIPARVFRVSFTGELSYEINVPASYGLALWQALMMAGEKYGITPFGTEAMHVLRAEVGFIIVGQETDGTVTPLDLGMDWMVSRAKDFLGKRSLSRADTARDDRPQLVGLLPHDHSMRLPEGAQLVASADPRPPVRMQGHVTSSYHSPNIGRTFALALLQRGGERHGETLYAAWDGRAVPVEVTRPRFFDMDGERARG